jgi:regulator of protease activity HflC (stomatin/prohibitin superfamily)
MDIFFFLLGFILAALGVLAFGVYTVGPTQRGIITNAPLFPRYCLAFFPAPGFLAGASEG